jgi:Tol biopolymer transport system component
MYCATWSAGGARVLCGFGGDQPGVFSIRSSDGGDPTRLTTNPYGASDVATDISPDGSRFVFLRYRPGPVHPGPKPFNAQQVALFTARLDGSGVRQLTPFGLAQAHEFAAAQWSPDGGEIVSETTHGRLFVIHPDGAGLTPIHVQTPTTRYFAFAPDWSPDGTRMVFCMFMDGQEDIYTAKADGSDLVRVTDTPDFENGPDWGRNPIEP